MSDILEKLPEIWDQHDSLASIGRELNCSRDHVRKMSAKLRKQGVYLSEKKRGGKPGIYTGAGSWETVQVFQTSDPHTRIWSVDREDAVAEAARQGRTLR